MGTLGTNITNALNLQDVELANAMNELRSNPGNMNTFLQQRRGELYNTVASEHSDSFGKVFGDLQRATDTTKNILYYHVRNKDLANIQNNSVDKASFEARNASYDNQNARRQFEINQWTAGNKTDTLFVLQLFFIYFTLTAPLLYALNAGMIPSSVFYGVTGFISIAIVLTLIVRYQYTSKTRDNHLWNRRRFATMGPPVLPNCPAVTGVVADFLENTSQTISSAETAAANMASQNLSYLANQAQSFSAGIGGTAPA